MSTVSRNARGISGLALCAAVLAWGCTAGPAAPAGGPPAGPPAARGGPTGAELRTRARSTPLVVAHRGDSAALPENTVPAFRSAIERRADLVELDFHETRDGVLVCVHDETLDRTTDAEQALGRKEAKVSEASVEEVAGLDAGRWKDPRFAGTRIPTLEEALRAIAPGAIAMVEHKRGGAGKLVELLRRLDLVERVLVQSFDWPWLEELRGLEPRVAVAALGGKELTEERLRELERTGACMVHWDARALRLEDFARLHRLGYLVAVYTIDDEISFLGAFVAGADAVTTNRPGELRALLDAGTLRSARP
ncbi:MAG: hypothetical protein HY721_21570 [Planctomycetes bacterium]|nr:hypothetical protein [Planctomycetota bacterium]